MTADAGRSVRELARAKVNLYLHVTGRRPDGYHTLDSLVVFAETGDTVTAEPSRVLSLSLDGPFGDVLEVGEGNLVLRAAVTLQDRVHARTGARPGAALLLTKRLPVASGIGGGSADAAATLQALDRLWDAGLSEDELRAVALPLGADVPVCVGSRSATMRGIGEVLAAAPALPACWMLLVNPMRGLETATVFAARDPAASTPRAEPPARFGSVAELGDWLTVETRNDLGAAARSLMPEIGEIEEALAALPGTRFARMSGSGATCVALFDGREAALEAARTLEAEHPTWWIEPAPLAR